MYSSCDGQVLQKSPVGSVWGAATGWISHFICQLLPVMPSQQWQSIERNVVHMWINFVATESWLVCLLMCLHSEGAFCITRSSHASTDVGRQFWRGTSDRIAHWWNQSGIVGMRHRAIVMWWSWHIQRWTSLPTDVDIVVRKTLKFGLLLIRATEMAILPYHNR